MKYNIIKEHYKNFSIFEINKIRPRAYYIPFADKSKLDTTTFLDERYKSDKVQVLSGEWDFKYYDKISKVPVPFDTEVEKFDKISVPSTWQRTGYENPWYLNTRYQFKMKPPVIPSDIPMSVYRKEFLVGDISKNYILTFLGAAATLEVYINGDFVGYSEGSHNTAEFDISKYIKNGLNEMLVIVHKWCNGTYLECQDMFRENGIFRDVYITERETVHINDFYANATKDGNNYNLNISVDVVNATDDYTIEALLIDSDGKIIASQENIASEITTILFEKLSVLEWNAEIPNIYTLFISLKFNGILDEVIRHYIGFKTVAIKGEVFYLNNQNIKIKGVNHHDTDAKNGYVMSVDELLRDVKIIKEYNCNAVRMAHYPPDPILITMCDIYGLYVIDEMDLECHGIYQNPLSQRFGLISNNLSWESHFLDRAQRMYFRDRNHASIIMWSLGNEAGGYKCHDSCYHFFKSVSKIPVHYEGVIHTKRHSYDVISQMYPHTNNVTKIGEHTFDKKFEGKPYFLCEYAHAMGVGPGALDRYMDIFYKYDNIMGGCIWEFCDHAVLHNDGKYKYTYGGDHNEPKHDGNFCVDGLFFPDRTPSTGALEMREVYRPIIAKKVAENVYQFTNTNRFIDTSNIAITWNLMRDGDLAESGNITINILPKCKEDVLIKHMALDANHDYFIIFEYTDNDGNYIAKEQIALNETQFEVNVETGNKIEIKTNNNIVTVFFDKGSLVFDKSTGEIVSYNIDDVEMINSSPHLGLKGILPTIYRGEIDNDRFIKTLWVILGYSKSKPQFKSCKIENNNDEVIIDTKYFINCFGKIATVKIKYTISANGCINIVSTIKKSLKLAIYNDIPRFGLTIEMPREFKIVEYYGQGDKESLSDFNKHTVIGKYKTEVSDMHEKYIKPQESGNRTGVRYAKLINDDGQGLVFVHSGEYLNFNANHFTLNDIVTSAHAEDLKNYDTTCVHIDGIYRGAGSQSCGQGPVMEHKPNISKPFTFEFKIVPINVLNRKNNR